MDPQQIGGPVSYNSSPGSSKKTLVIVILAVLLIASLAFGGWAYSQMNTYKNNSDKNALAAVSAAQKQLTDKLQAQFDEQSKSPNKTFKGSATYGSVTFNYPKTWSAYVDTSGSSEPINGYFYPGEVPGTQSKTAYALRVELVATDYSQVMQQFNSLISQGTITAKAYVPPKMQGVANVVPGAYLTGQINSQDQKQRGSMLVIKVRDKTLEVSTQSSEFSNDFNNIVLSSLTFAP